MVTIWDRFYKGMALDEIKGVNPFASKDWLGDGADLTLHRQQQIESLFNGENTITSSRINLLGSNRGKYAAFRAIVHGIAVPDDKGGITRTLPNTAIATTKPQHMRKPNVSEIAELSHRANLVQCSLDQVQAIREELKRRKRILIAFAHDMSTPIDLIERAHILQYLAEEKLPGRPTDEIQLMKEFVSSALSINQPPYRTRNRLTALLGEIPLANTIPLCLQKLTENSAFLTEENWRPIRLASLAKSTQEKLAGTNRFEMDVLKTIAAIGDTMERELLPGITGFYDKISNVLTHGPEHTWSFLEDFTSDIPGVGPVLMADFLKNIGFTKFVKIDQRLKNEFPILVSEVGQGPKSMFIYSWHLCQELRMTPFVFDQILYQWANPKLRALLAKTK